MVRERADRDAGACVSTRSRLAEAPNECAWFARRRPFVHRADFVKSREVEMPQISQLRTRLGSSAVFASAEGGRKAT